MAYLTVRVTPGGKRDEIIGWQGSALRVRVRAAPEKGKANDAVCALIAAALSAPRRSVLVERGQTSRDKLLLIDGLSEDELTSRLGGPVA